MSNGRVILIYRGFRQMGEDRLRRGERGAVEKDRNVVSETVMETFTFNVGGTWAPVSKELRIAFPKNRDLNKEQVTSEGTLEISAEVASPDGVLYIDNVKLEPKPE